MNRPCPCGSGQAYADCCGRHLETREPAPTALALMRSRYTAYTLGREDYLLRTWHPSTRPATLGLEQTPGLEHTAALKWLGLKILGTEAGGAEDGTGVVEFVARSKIHGRAQRLHERSRFVKEDGRWLYVDGEIVGD